MVLISVHLPISQLKKLEELVKEGHFPSVSEAIRHAINKLIEEHIKEGVVVAL
ncbi:MAG: CopG family transcriptional regulator [Candidatus Methanomethylicota archaeon]|uniref:CopG family transcriptional regulator n=1 Tax=Thermoproteota archaeon TaxID=2056631 RepID=A0A497F1Z7_9CREN|nr:MAG: CopG family transcriptional regulator [Candidatus Verstraetearchaeota archaeon]